MAEFPCRLFQAHSGDFSIPTTSVGKCVRNVKEEFIRKSYLNTRLLKIMCPTQKFLLSCYDGAVKQCPWREDKYTQLIATKTSEREVQELANMFRDDFYQLYLAAVHYSREEFAEEAAKDTKLGIWVEMLTTNNLMPEKRFYMVKWIEWEDIFYKLATAITNSRVGDIKLA